MKQPALIYVYDPMCSWCWGYRPTWLKLQEQLSKHLIIEYCVGGLAPDSTELMPEDMQDFLKGTWQKISTQLGTQFNFNFWRECQPRRSTYPACRAVIVAREQAAEQSMYHAIQEAYYLDAKNPSDTHVLVELAANIGLDVDKFETDINSKSVNDRLQTEIAAARQLPISGFPSLVLSLNGQYLPIQLDYKNWQTSYQIIMAHLSANTA